jgi:DNA (cytosine-5)-methyltransferase 1
MAPRSLAGLALCAGVGGLELGLHLALGRAYRTVGYVEREAFAAAILVARMADQTLDPAPVWDDIETFNGTPWRGRVDLVSAGFPCQPFSAAGQGRGINDERWLWPNVARVIDEVDPGFVFIENVPPLVHKGLQQLLGDLAQLGFDVQWTCLSAAAVGATQRRNRFWALAHRNGQRLPRLGRRPDDIEHHPDRPSRAALANTGRTGLEPQPPSSPGRQSTDARRPTTPDHQPERAHQSMDRTRGRGAPARHHTAGHDRAPPAGHAEPDSELANPTSTRRQGSLHRAPPGRTGPARPGEGLRLWPPVPDDRRAWQQALEAGGPEPGVRRVADGLAHRVDRLRAIGNGVVPLVAAHAFVGLARRAGLVEPA